MKLHKLAGDLVEVTVDLDTSIVVQVENKLSGAKHIFSRKPELELKTVGMGVVELEPSYCNDWSVEMCSHRELVATCRSGSLGYTKTIRVEEGKTTYSYCVKNLSNTSTDVRLRVALYLACGKGGFWGDEDALGATNTCRYYVSYGFGESWNTFSTAGTPGGSRGFLFEKHSYRSKWFPELKWIAVVDKSSGEGIVVKCLNPNCYAAVEDQFFNLEVNLVNPLEKLPPHGEACLTFELLPFSGLSRIDYVDDRFIVGIESPSIAKPSERYSGYLALFPLSDLRLQLEGHILHVRGMQSIGKRGYCVDRVTYTTRKTPLQLEKSTVEVEKYKPVKIKFQSITPIKWSFEEELYEIPFVTFTINGVFVRRAVSINPDIEDALAYVPDHLKKFAEKYVHENPPIESEFMEREASKPIYELILSTRFNPRKIVTKKIRIREDVFKHVLSYLDRKGVRKFIEAWSTPVRDPRQIARAPVLDIAIAYRVTESGTALRALENTFRAFSDLVLEDSYVTYFSPVHGGGGVDHFADLVLALDLVESYLDESLVKDIYVALSFIGREVSKLLNTWTGNWELSEAAALLAIAYKLGYPGYDVDVYRALTTARRALESFLPDGGWPELAASYHIASISHLIKIGEISDYVGLFNLYTYSSRSIRDEPVIKKALMWLWNILTPRYTTPALEDTNEFIPPPDIFLLPGAHLYDKDLLAIAFKLRSYSNGFNSPYTYLRLLLDEVDLNTLEKETEYKPRARIVVLKESGRFIFRESEDQNSLYFILDFGPQGGWHGHPDRLSFELYYRGVPVVVDAGSGGYYNPLHWVWSRRSIVHNTVTFGTDDHPESSRGRLLELRELEDGFYAVFQFELDEERSVNRSVLLSASDKILVVYDVVYGYGIFRWNIHCNGRVENRVDSTVSLKINSTPYILVAPPGVILSVDSGYRGPNEIVPYVYYDLEIKGRGEMWGAIVLDEDNRIKAVKKTMKYLNSVKLSSSSQN